MELAAKLLITIPLAWAYLILLSSMTIVLAPICSIVLAALLPRFRRALIAGSAVPPSIVEIFVLISVSVFIVTPYVYFNGWQQASTYIWNNTFLIVIVLISVALKAFFLRTENPYVRRTTNIVIEAPISMAVILAIGYFLSDMIDPWMVRSAVVIATVVLVVQVVFTALKTIPRVRQFEEIRAQNQTTSSRLLVLQGVVELFAGTLFGEQLGRLVKSVQSWQATALEAARRGDLGQAENAHVVCKIEIAEIDRKLDEETELQNIITQRFQQLKQEIHSLAAAYEERSLATAEVDYLARTTEEFAASVDAGNIQTTAEYFQELDGKLERSRAALRLREGLEAELTLREADLSSYGSIVELGEHLSLHVEHLEASVEQAHQSIQHLREQEIKNVDELPKMMQAVEVKMRNAIHGRQALLTDIASHWSRSEHYDGAMVFYVPKYCKSDEAAKCVMEVQMDRLGRERISLSVSGSFVSVEGDGKFNFERGEVGHVERRVFYIAGEKAGRGALTFRSEDFKPTHFAQSIEIRVVPTRADLVKESSAWGTPASALLVIGAWYSGADIQTWAPVAASAGVALGLMVFGFRYVTALRPYR